MVDSFNPMTGNTKKMVEELRHEISERRLAEESLKESEKKFKVLYESSRDAIMVLAPDQGFLNGNPACIELFGCRDEEEFTSNTPAELSPVYQPDGTLSSIKAQKMMAIAMEKGTHFFEWKHKRTDGTEFFTSVLLTRLELSGRKFLQATVRDITKNKQAEEALRRARDELELRVQERTAELNKANEGLRESEERFRTLYQQSNQREQLYASLLNSAPDAVVISNLNGETVYINPAFTRIFGFITEEIIGKRISFVPESETEKTAAVIQHVLGGKPVSGFETKRLTKDGTVLEIITSSSCYYDHQGKLAGIVMILRDVTETKQMERQLLQSQKMEAIGTLTGGVAHDFNNLLTSIIGYAELSMLRLDQDNPLQENIEEIMKAANSAASLTRQLLAFSRNQVLQPVVLNLNTVTANMEKMLGRIIEEDVELKTILAPDLADVEADSGQIEQVIMNLAVNARDAMPQGGKLTIETANVDLDENYFHDHGVESVPGPYVMLAVSDTGIGMDKKTQSRIFEPFFTTKEKGKGTGLGLSTVYGIIKQSKGYIWVYSEPGHGTTFKVYLSRMEGEAVLLKKEKKSKALLTGYETVLVVEDNDALRKLAVTILDGQGYTVLKAQNGEEALRIGKEHKGPIHLLLTDVVMPRMSGWDLEKRLRPLRPEIKVIYMSGYTDNTILYHGVLDPQLSFLQKPFTVDDLGRKVRKVLDQRMED